MKLRQRGYLAEASGKITGAYKSKTGLKNFKPGTSLDSVMSDVWSVYLSNLAGVVVDSLPSHLKTNYVQQINSENFTEVKLEHEGDQYSSWSIGISRDGDRDFLAKVEYPGGDRLTSMRQAYSGGRGLGAIGRSVAGMLLTLIGKNRSR